MSILIAQPTQLHGHHLHLIKLYAIERGLLTYLPKSVPAIRTVKDILDDIFSVHTTLDIAGHPCLHKQDIRAGIHRRVLNLMGYACIACNTHHNKNINVHHIKPSWRTWNNAWGFTTLCQECHKSIRSGLCISDNALKGLCLQFNTPSSPYYDPPNSTAYPEPTIVKLPHINYFYKD